MRLFVGNGIGPLILASVAVAASMILSHAACMCDVSKDFKRILIFDAATGAAAVERERERETTRVREDFKRDFIHSKKGMHGKTETKTTKTRGRFARARSLYWRGGERDCARTRESKTQRERESSTYPFYPFFFRFSHPQKGRKQKRKFSRARSESARNDARANTETPGKGIVRANLDENYPFLSFFLSL